MKALSSFFLLVFTVCFSTLAMAQLSTGQLPFSNSSSDDGPGGDCLVNTLSLNTGVDHANNQLYPIPAGLNDNALVRDPYWSIVQMPNTSIPAIGNAWVIPAVPVHWDNPSPVTARWLSALRTNRYPFSNSNPFVFERCFCLEEAGNVNLDFTVFGDDALTEISVGGTSVYSNPGNLGPNFGTGQGISVQQTIPLAAGKNCLQITLSDIFGDRFGFKVEGELSSPFLEKNDCCDPQRSISGFKFYDQDGNGVWDSNEGALVHWPILLSNGQTTHTNLFGYYSFDNLPAGAYAVSEGQQPGYQQTYPANGQPHTVVLNNWQSITCNFGNTLEVPPPPSSQIFGKKFYDINCNGIQDFGEPPLSGWVFDLYTDGSTPYQTAISDENGCFSFSNLPAGFYTLRERTKPGWQVSTPASGVIFIDMGDEESYEIEFGNCLLEDPDACCDDNPDLEVFREDFEAGNNYVYTYQQGSGQVPGEFAFVDQQQASAISPAWNVKGYDAGGNCDANDKFLVVNGRTGLSGEEMVYRSNLLDTENAKKYSVCAQFKNLPQCAFDVLPTVRLEVVHVFGLNPPLVIFSSPPSQINTGSSDCDYQTISGTFTGVSPTFFQGCFIRVYLDETGIGDGNDLVIDEIVVQEVPRVSPTTFTLQSNDVVPNATYNLTADWDPSQHPGCTPLWEVFAVDATVDPDQPLPGTYSSDPNWGPNTNFPGYNTSGSIPGLFQYNTVYKVRLTVDCPCEEAYQITKPYWKLNEIMDLNGTVNEPAGDRAIPLPKMDHSATEIGLQVYPNPFTNTFQTVFPKPTPSAGKVSIYAANGQLVGHFPYPDKATKLEVDLSNYPSGHYILRVNLAGQQVQRQLIKQ